MRTVAIAAALALACGSAIAQQTATGANAAAPQAEAMGAGHAATTAAGTVTLANAGTRPDPGIGHPLGGYHIQPQVTKFGQRASHFNNWLLAIMAVITIIVFALMAWAAFRFRRSRNPVPSKTAHNTLVEVIWTVLPVLILVGIAIPSFKLLAAQYDPPKADLTIKATGHQWYWSYEYPDQGNFGFDSVILTDQEDDAAGEPENLGVDNRIVVPVGAVVKMLVTSSDVIHSWAVPAFWVKMDAIPGRINETWFKAERPGVYYGQCSELCGTGHGFMPIAVEVVPQQRFDAWVAMRQADAGVQPAGASAAAQGAQAPAALAVPTAAPVEPPSTPQPINPPQPSGVAETN